MLRGEEDIDAEDDEELADLQRARMLYSALRETVEQIESTGAEVKGVVEGLVDFYSWMDDRTEVMLCWKLGEATIEHFHGLEDGYAGRKPVTGHRFSPERPQVEIAPVVEQASKAS